MRALQTFLLFNLTAACCADTADVSRQLEGLIADTQIPGIVSAAWKDGEVLASGAAGVRKVGSKSRVKISDRFHIGSCTKSMTATLAALLVADGKIRWDETLSEAFPTLTIHPQYQSVTLQQLLTNSGGAPGEVDAGLWKQAWLARGSQRSQRMLFARGTLTEAPVATPGTKYVYSNTGFSLAGVMIEEACDEAFEKVLLDRLFVPLGMDSAGFRAPAKNGQVDQPYGHVLRGGELVSVDPEPAGDNPAAIAPAGAVHCSALDFLQYAQLHLGNHPQLVIKSVLDFMHQPAVDGYAMGWQVTQRAWGGGKVLTHAGSNTMFFAVIWIAPKKNFAAVAMCNSGVAESRRICDQAIALMIREYLD